MFIKRNTRVYKGKTYVNYLLVESVSTPKGSRHRVVCSLGSLEPAPREEWAALAQRMQASLAGQRELFQDSPSDEAGGPPRSRRGRPRRAAAEPGSAENALIVPILIDLVEVEGAREAGTVHVGHQLWKELGLPGILAEAGLSDRACTLTEAMALNRLIFPTSEHAMPDWIRRTAMGDILGVDFSNLNEDPLYANLDQLHPRRGQIERDLAKRERTLFNLEESVFLYDLTSTYFEGQCLANPKAARGYSRDKRPDCKQVVVGLVLDGDGFPKAHEIFKGNTQDRTTVGQMLDVLEARTGRKGGGTVVVDRGMAYDDDLQEIRARDHHYLVAWRQSERKEYLAEFEDEEGWEEVIREPSPRNPAQKKSKVFVKRAQAGEEVHILCLGEGRQAKDRAIREKHEARLMADLQKLQRRVEEGKLKAEPKIHEAIGRLKERHSRVARYFAIEYLPQTRRLTWVEDQAAKKRAERLDGAYILKTDRQDLTADEIWRTYILLTRVEAAFRAMKSPLMERPIFHQLEHRVETHIFLCILAYHLLVAIEKRFLDQGIHTSWATLREQLSTHQVVTIVLPAADGRVLRIRKATAPEQEHRDIYRALGIPDQIIKPIKEWSQAESIGVS